MGISLISFGSDSTSYFFITFLFIGIFLFFLFFHSFIGYAFGVSTYFGLLPWIGRSATDVAF